jgi:hypothetical protein
MIPFQLHRRIPLVRRPFLDRDQALRERDAAVEEMHRASRERDAAVEEMHRASRQRDAAVEEMHRASRERDAAVEEMHRASRQRDAAVEEMHRTLATFVETANTALPSTPSARTSSVATVDATEIVARIIAAYRASIATRAGPQGSFWEGTFAEMKQDVHDALVSDDFNAAQRLLRDPGRTDLCYGFDVLARSLADAVLNPEGISAGIYTLLLLLLEALGARRLWNPEAPKATASLPDVETLLASLDSVLGFRIEFPNPFADEIGLATSRGVASYRAIEAIHQAWRIFSLVKGNIDARVAEIGAGMGRTALYAKRLGLRDYTIIDLPMSAVAQANFLGRALGAEDVCLFGEDRHGIRILPPAAFLDASDRYDLVVNVDSLTEMAHDTAFAYCRAINARSGLFLSINHEAAGFTAREICTKVGMLVAARTPYWMRRGYADEVFTPRP